MDVDNIKVIMSVSQIIKKLVDYRPGTEANSVDPDQMPHNVASDQSPLSAYKMFEYNLNKICS